MTKIENLIGKRVEERTIVDGHTYFKAIICECGGSIYYDERGDPVCLKCGMLL